MKKYFFIPIVLSVLVAALTGCTDPEASLTTASTGTAVNATGSCISVDITTDSTKKSKIPDPITAEKEVSLILPDQGYESKCENCDGYSELCTDCKENLFTDLSFAGFKEPVIATSFTIGSVADEIPCSFRVPDSKTGEKKEQKGTCLLLMVTNTDKEGKDDDSPWQDENYLVILDYANQRYDKIKTNFEYTYGYLHWYDMAFRDLTGDGQEELIVSYEFNKGAIGMDVFDFNTAEQKLKMIFSHPYAHECANYTSFSGQLLDNYNAVLEYREIQFSTTVSLLDIGYKKKHLDIDKVYYDDYGLDPYWPVRLWKNGTLQAKGKKKEAVYLYVMNKVAFPKTKEGIPQIRLRNAVMVGHRSCCIGDIYTYFQYNKEKESMELCAAKFEAYEYSRK